MNVEPFQFWTLWWCWAVVCFGAGFIACLIFVTISLRQIEKRPKLGQREDIYDEIASGPAD